MYDGSAYFPIDGEDVAINIDDMVTSTIVNTSNAAVIETISDHGACKRSDFDCDFQCFNASGCDYSCLGTASCLGLSLNCSSLTGCNLICEDRFSCSDVNVSITGSDSSSQFHLDCKGQRSCVNAYVYISDVESAHIHCRVEESCIDMNIIFDAISTKNNSNTSISCYSANACKNLYIEADGPLTKLHMYEYSENVVLNNGYGWNQELKIMHFFVCFLFLISI